MDWLLWWAEGGFFDPLVLEGFSHVNLVSIFVLLSVFVVAWLFGFRIGYYQLVVVCWLIVVGSLITRIRFRVRLESVF